MLDDPLSRPISMAAALREATEHCLRTDPHVYLMGEGVADPKGIFGTTSGLLAEFGVDRVIEMPVAENGLTGIAIGSALLGRRPIMVHQRADFGLLALEQILNNAAKARFLSNGAHRVPLTIRLIIGRGWGQGPAHSQALEALFAHFPGIKCALPSTPFEAKGMLIAAVEDDDPVILLEHRWSHHVTGHVPAGAYRVPLSGPAQTRQGDELTIVSSSYNMLEAHEAADAMRSAGVTADVFDLRVLRPLEITPILESVRRTGRLIIVDLGWRMYGIGAEIVARVVENCLADLKAPPRRLGLPDYPTPSSRALAASYYPNSVTIMNEVARLIPAAAERLVDAVAIVAARRAELPSDQPYPSFRGPF
jgi:pyruvate dehydrogenase E1 component beta subunit